MMLSPPMLVIVGAGIVSFLLKSFLPEKYIWPIATIGGGAVAPWLFSHGTLAYDVPSPGTALVIIGGIMGFLGSVFHRRLDRWFGVRKEAREEATRQFSRFTTPPGASRETPLPP